VDFSSEKSSIERVMNNTINQPHTCLESDNYVLSVKNEKHNLSNPTKPFESLFYKISHDKQNILDLSISNGKRKFFRVNLKDRVCQVIDGSIKEFMANFRQDVIKKSLEVYKNIMNKKFEEKVRLFNNIHEQITSIEMMINDENSKIFNYKFIILKKS
jgi:hypothetical protein